MKLIYTYIIITFAINTINLLSQTVNINPVKDNTMYSEGDSSNGKGIYLFSGVTNRNYERRALIKFDLSSIKQDDSVVSVTLELYVSKTKNDGHIFSLHRLTHDWGEGTSLAIYEEGGGATVTTGDATWNYAFFDTSSWINKGGDFLSQASTSFQVDTIGTYSWSNDTMLADIKKWVHEPATNFGWILLTKDSVSSSKRFNSRENSINPPLLSLKILPATSIHQDEVQNLLVFPNPGNGDIFISAKNNAKIDRISVFDISGKVIDNTFYNKVRISSNEFHLQFHVKGIFIIEVNNSIHKKIIIY